MNDKLTDQEKVFVEEYCGSANFNAVAAARSAGYRHHGHRDRSLALLKKPHIQRAIEGRIETRAAVAWYSEDDILKLLHKEATREGRGSSHAARIQAIVYLGKHIGMFREREKEAAQDNSTNIQIVNYSNGESIKKLVKENEKEVIEHKDDPIIPNLLIEDYSDGVQGVSEESGTSEGNSRQDAEEV